MTPPNYDVDRVQKLAKDARESGLKTVEIARIIFPDIMHLDKKEVEALFRTECGMTLQCAITFTRLLLWEEIRRKKKEKESVTTSCI